jgi:hypothetical protein
MRKCSGFHGGNVCLKKRGGMDLRDPNYFINEMLAKQIGRLISELENLYVCLKSEN